MKPAKSWLPGLAVLAAVLLTLLPPRPVRGLDIAGFCRLPVLEGGRVKPLDTVARNSLLVISGRRSLAGAGRRLQADEWLLDVLFRPSVARTHPVFLIDDPEVLGFLGLGRSPGRRFSFASLEPRLPEIARQAYAASRLDPSGRNRFQGAVLDLYRRLDLYCQLEDACRPTGEGVERSACFRPLVPLAGQPPESWQSIGEGREAGTHPALALLDGAGAAYAADDAGAFNRSTEDLGRLSASLRPDLQARASHEALFNRAEPFYLGMVIYAAALLALFASWAWRPDLLQPAAFSLLAAGLLVHTAGLASRILLQGRPPVTNLYSSAVFAGWAAVLLGTILEWVQRRGFATAVACVLGFASLLVAHHLSGDGDTMEMMRAVLNSNFWLTAHVLTITIGFGSTFLAGTLAVAHTLHRHLARDPKVETSRALSDATCGVVRFALLFCVAGTVLGGIWADQSWGRFWGWDPKENGALLVVLWNALILHARLGKAVQERGLMAMAIGGNIVVSLAWFGVNLLGVGLHAYGFTGTGVLALEGFVLSQALLIGLCLLPRRQAG